MAGNSHSSQEQATSPFPKINHPKFKDIKVFKDEDIIRSTITTQQQSDYEQWELRLNKTASIDDEVILLPKAYQFLRKALCGSACTIQIDYDNYPYILADELENRRAVNRYFSEPELWYLLYSLVTAAHDFQKLNERIGDVRPENIFINQQGHIKVSNLFSWPGEVSNYIKTVYDHEKTYLSPEEAEAAREGKNENYIDKFKAESFSIGLTVLETALIRDLDSLYLQSKGFDFSRYHGLMKEWWSFKYPHLDEATKTSTQKQYSDIFKLVLSQMCELKPEDRLLSDEVYGWLKKYHEEINQLKTFTPGLPPIKNKDKYANFLRKAGGQLPVSGGLPIQGQGGPRDGYLQHFQKYADPNPPYPQPFPAYQPKSQFYGQNQLANQNKFVGGSGQFSVQPPNLMNTPSQPFSNGPIYNSGNTTSNLNAKTTVSKFVVGPEPTPGQAYGSSFQKQNYYPVPNPETRYQQYNSPQLPPLVPPPASNTRNLAPSGNQQFKGNQPFPMTGTYPITQGSNEARSIQFLRQVDQKLNKLKQQSL